MAMDQHTHNQAVASSAAAAVGTLLFTKGDALWSGIAGVGQYMSLRAAYSAAEEEIAKTVASEEARHAGSISVPER